jgi:beta-glucosidase-like glycosyl hydrolase
MQMHAITKRFGEDEAAVLAVEAGADVVLMPADGERAFEAVMRATEVGRLTRALLEERVRRIWRLKEWASSRGGPPDPTRLRELEAEHASLSKEVAKKAIEIKGNLDLSGSPSLILICDDREDVVQKANRLQRKLSNTFGAIQIFTPKTWDDDAANVNENTIIASFHRARGFLTERATEWTVPRMMASIATSMTDRGIAPQGLILFGSPYLDGEFKTAPDFVIKTFSESGVSIEAVVEWLSTIAG